MWYLPDAFRSFPRRVPLAPVILALVLAAAVACATANTMSQARRAERAEDFDLAVAHYSRLLRMEPDNRDARLGLDRAKLRASQVHLARGRRLHALGKFDDAVVELQLAYELNPTSGVAEDDLRTARAALRTKLAARQEGETALEALLARTRNLAPAGFELPDLKLPASIDTGSQTTSRQAYLILAKLAKLSVVFDPQFADSPAQVSLNNMTLRQALDAIAGSTNTFYKVTGAQTLTVIPDNPAKRREYQDEQVRTFLISNLDMKEVVDLLRVVTDVRQISVLNTNQLSIRDTPERLHAVSKLLVAIDKARAEVGIDVEILEVDRTRLREFGLQLASPGSTGAEGSLDVNSEQQTLRSLRSLTSSDVLISGVPALYYRLLKTDSSTRTLANPHLRTIDGSLAQAKFGERIPVPSSEVVPLFQGGANQQIIRNVKYEDIGVNIDITPRTHTNNDVTLAVKISLSSVSGTGFGGYPTFGNREITTTIRLKDGETNILAGLIRDNERTIASGIPGLMDLPIIGRLFARNQREKQETDIVLTLTPHIIRVLDLREEDLRPIVIRRDGSGGPVELMPIAPPPPRDPVIIK